MAWIDLPLDQLRAYAPALEAPADLDAFWTETLAASRAHPIAATFQPVDSGLTTIETWDVTFAGFDGQPIRAWLHAPRLPADDRELPAVVEYLGYGGGRGLPHERTLY